MTLQKNILESSLNILKPIEASKHMVEKFSFKNFYRLLGLKEPPDLDFLHTRIKDKRLMIWEVQSKITKENYAYVIYILYDGPPYIEFYNFTDSLNLDWIKDALLEIIHFFFSTTDHSGLFFYLDKPIPEEINTLLIENGFDRFDDCPIIDHSLERAYVLERYTYEAYHYD